MDFLIDPIAKPKQDPTRAGPIKPKWDFTDEELRRSPSVLGGISFSEEQRLICYGCTFIRKIADRLNDVQKELPKITQLCVSVSIIQLRRFFTIQSLQSFDARDVGAAILFLATKCEECPRRLEYIVRAWYKIRHEFDAKVNQNEPVAISKEVYEKCCDYITWIENVALQTLGFNFEVVVPHPIVLGMAQKHRSSDKKFQENVFWLVTDSLHLTNWALRFKAPTIAIICYYVASVWKDEPPRFPPDIPNGESWYQAMDKTITLTFLQDMAKEFVNVWKDVDKNVNLSMSQFDHATVPVILDRAAVNNKPVWNQ
jgi:protein BUR2